MEDKNEVIKALNDLKADFEKREKELRCKIENFDKCSKLIAKDVINIDIAEDVLKDLKCDEHIKFTENQFCRKIDWIAYKIQTAIKAVNYLDNNNKLWVKDFTNNKNYFTPYFYLGDGSFSYRHFRLWASYSFVGLGWGFKNKETMLFIVDKFLSDYKFYHTGK